MSNHQELKAVGTETSAEEQEERVGEKKNSKDSLEEEIGRSAGGQHRRKTLHWQSKALKVWTALWDYYFFYLFIHAFFTKSKVTFNVLKVPEKMCPFTKKKADAETLAPVLKRCSERSIIRDIKASQSPRPPL